MKNNKGFATLFIILAVLVVGGGSYALVSRNVLKSFFQTGDKPTQDKDKSASLDVDVAADVIVAGDKPSSPQFGSMIDSSLNMLDDKGLLGLKEYNPTKDYQTGDTSVKSSAIYQAKVVTQDQKEFKLDADQSVTFRFTPIVPKPQEPVTYRLRVWQLMQGQNGTQAMKTNKPIVTKDVTNNTEVTVSGLYTGPCKPPYLCDFIWNVDVLVEESSEAGSGTGVGVSTSTNASAETNSR